MTIHIAYEDNVANLTINTGSPLGLLTPELLTELRRQLSNLEPNARVLVLRTDGVKAFSAGANIKNFAELDGQQMWQQWLAPGQQVFDQLAKLPIPTIAVVHAHAMGGGLELALACDLRVAAESATFSLPETGIAAIPGWGGVTRVTELVGKARALDLILTRRRLTAAESENWGLISRVAPKEDLEAAVADLTTTLLSGSPTAQSVSKAIISSATNPQELLAIAEGFGGGLLNTTADHDEGVAAFTEKRAPRY